MGSFMIPPAGCGNTAGQPWVGPLGSLDLLAHCPAGEAPDDDVLPRGGNGLLQQVADLLLILADVDLAQQAAFAVELVHPALDDLVDDLLWLALRHSLGPRLLALCLQPGDSG